MLIWSWFLFSCHLVPVSLSKCIFFSLINMPRLSVSISSFYYYTSRVIAIALLLSVPTVCDSTTTLLLRRASRSVIRCSSRTESRSSTRCAPRVSPLLSSSSATALHFSCCCLLSFLSFSFSFPFIFYWHLGDLVEHSVETFKAGQVRRVMSREPPTCLRVCVCLFVYTYTHIHQSSFSHFFLFPCTNFLLPKFKRSSSFPWLSDWDEI